MTAHENRRGVFSSRDDKRREREEIEERSLFVVCVASLHACIGTSVVCRSCCHVVVCIETDEIIAGVQVVTRCVST